jgi:hypothetical protein
MPIKEKGLKGAMLTGLKKPTTPIAEPVKAEEGEIKRTFALPTNLLDQLEREAFWERKTQKDILVELLTMHYSNKSFEPLPATYRKPKRGKPRKSII